MRVESTESEHAAGWGRLRHFHPSLPRLAQCGLRGLRLADLGAHLQLAQLGDDRLIGMGVGLGLGVGVGVGVGLALGFGLGFGFGLGLGFAWG